MKIAHLILAHNHPAQLERLVNRLSHPDAHVYIHLDLKTDISAFRAIAQIPGAQFVSARVPVMWGEYSVIQATLNGMEEILASGIDYSHINLLSGNDYPLKKPETIHEFFFAHTGKSFMWFDEIFPDWPDGQSRVNGYYLGDYGFPGRYLVAKIMTRLLPARKMPLGLVAYGRAQWLTITPEAAAYTIRYINDNPRVRTFLMQTWCVDEVFFQTILCNSPLRSTLVNDNKRLVLLDPGCIPITLTMEHVDLLAAAHDKFYARKFNIETEARIFDHIDNFRQ